MGWLAPALAGSSLRGAADRRQEEVEEGAGRNEARCTGETPVNCFFNLKDVRESNNAVIFSPSY